MNNPTKLFKCNCNGCYACGGNCHVFHNGTNACGNYCEKCSNEYEGKYTFVQDSDEHKKKVQDPDAN